MTTMVFQDEHFDATPEEVFEVLADSQQHSQMTGSAASIDLKPGGRFSAYNGELEGEVVEFERPKRLVLNWRGKDWPKGESTVVTFDIEPIDQQVTLLHLTHEGLPDAYFEACSRGWGDSYWSRMRPYFLNRRKEIVEHFIEEYKNQHNWDSVDTYIAEDCKLHLPALDLPPGREGMRLNGRTVCTAFPDVHVTREFFVVEKDIVVERAHAKATHKAELLGVPASNNPVTWTELHAYRVQNGQITEIWTEADFIGILVQIGAVQMPTQ